MEGWRTVMKPIILERARVVKDLAFAIPSERPKPYSEMDDTTATSVLRGEAKALLWVANIFELTTHLRGQAGSRQVEGAKVGLAHVIGLGSACTIHVLTV